MMLNLNLKYAACVICLTALVFFGWFSPGYSEAEEAQTAAIVNGLDTTALNGLIETMKKNPDKGRVTFYSKSRWQDGMRSFTGFTGYKIDGTMVHEKIHQFVLLGDEALELGGTDTAPGAVEELMYAVATCVIAASNINAALMGVKLTRLDVDIESDLDMHGLLALDPNVRAGLTNMRMGITIAGDADEATLKKIATLGYQYSPVSETTRNGIKFTPVITVAK
ncbi:MAG: OsmC family protein [Thermodesulfobacteriota bacterium]